MYQKFLESDNGSHFGNIHHSRSLSPAHNKELSQSPPKKAKEIDKPLPFQSYTMPREQRKSPNIHLIKMENVDESKPTEMKKSNSAREDVPPTPHPHKKT